MKIGSKQLNLHDLKHLTFAGSKDALSLLLILIAFLLTSPFFQLIMGEVLRWTLIASCMLLGTMMLFEQKVRYYFEREFVFQPFLREDQDRPFLLTSATPPQTREEMESQPLQGLLAGYTTDTGDPVYLPYNRLPQHVSICGSTGTGKSVIGGFLMMQQMRNGGGLLFIDGKLSDKELDGIYKNACWAGREIDLVIINPAEPEYSNTYNPILYGDPQEVSSRIMALLPSTTDAGSDHYRSSAQQALETIISAFQRIGLPYHFEDLATVLLNEQALFHVEDLLINIDPDGNETVQYIQLLNRYRNRDGLNIEEFKKTLGGLAGRLHQFATGTFGKVMNSYNPEVNIQECIMQNKIVYVMLPTMGKNEQAIALAKLIVADCRTAISRCQKLPTHLLPNPPFMIFPDEAGSYMEEQSWSRIFEQARSSNIFMMPAYQTFANLQPNGDKTLSEVVMGNTYFKFFFKQLSTESATQAADELGKHYRTTSAIATGVGTSSSGAEIDASPVQGIGDNRAINFTQREEEVHIVRPEHFKNIPIGDCLLVAGGTHLYHLRIPFMSPTLDAKNEFKRITLNKFERDEVIGLNLNQVLRKYTISAL